MSCSARGSGRWWSAHIVLSLVGMLFLSAHSPAQPRVVGYYPMWLKGVLPAVNVKFEYVTHVNHAFAWPNPDGSISSDESPVDTAIINAAHRARKKILLSFGGAGATQTANFALVAADTGLRRKFIKNVVARLAAYHYDGADLDWEGPANNVDRQSEVALVQEMRAALRRADTTWLMTMAVGVTDYTGQWRDFTALRGSIDWFNAMTYDYFGSWSPYTGHNAPMVDPTAYAVNSSVTQGIDYLHKTRGIPGAQLTLGLPFFGMRFLNTAGLYKSFGSAAEVLYTEVRTDFAGGWTYAWDSLSQVPYLVDPTKTKLDSYDDSASIAVKCAYAGSAGLSGVMIWALGEDLWGGAQPLLTAVGNVMFPSTGVRADHVPQAGSGYMLYGNYPNPFNPSTTIRYGLPRRSMVSLTVYNVLGQEIARIVSGMEERGIHEARFESDALSSGTYFYRLSAGDFVQVREMVLLR